MCYTSLLMPRLARERPMAAADDGAETTSTRQQRRRRPRPGAEPSGELAADDALPTRGRSRRAVAPLASTMPSALGEKLHLQDRELLSAPLRVDEADLFPLDQDPMYITQPPVPSLGGEGVERYAEGTGRRFRRMPAQADGEQLATAASAEHSGATYVPPPPSGGTQAAFTFFGLMYHASGACWQASRSLRASARPASTVTTWYCTWRTPRSRSPCSAPSPPSRSWPSSAQQTATCAGACAPVLARLCRLCAVPPVHAPPHAPPHAPLRTAQIVPSSTRLRRLHAAPRPLPTLLPPTAPAAPPPAAPAAPCRRTHLSGLTLFLTGLYVVLVALQLPPDAAFHHGRWRPTPTPRYPPTPIHP